MTGRLLLMLVLVSSTLAWPQEAKGTIQGIVKDRQGAVIFGATVLLVDFRTLQCQKASTGEDGAYGFREIKSGKYQMLVGATNFETKVRIFKLASGKTVEFSLVLDVSSDGVIVD